MAGPKQTVLLVDDDEGVLRTFCRVLKRKGYFVVAAGSGREALDSLERFVFDAAIMDLHLPDAEGKDLLKMIQETAPNTTRIVLTGSPEAINTYEDAAKISDAFLLKPIEPEAFLMILEEKIRRKG